MLRAIIDEITGKKFLRNAQAMLRDLPFEIEVQRNIVANLEGFEQRHAQAKLSVLETRFAKLDNWFTEYGYRKTPKLKSSETA